MGEFGRELMGTWAKSQPDELEMACDAVLHLTSQPRTIKSLVESIAMKPELVRRAVATLLERGHLHRDWEYTGQATYRCQANPFEVSRTFDWSTPCECDGCAPPAAQPADGAAGGGRGSGAGAGAAAVPEPVSGAPDGGERPS